MVNSQGKEDQSSQSQARVMKGVQELFAIQLLGVMEDTLVLVLDRQGKVVLAGENAIRWIQSGAGVSSVDSGFKSPRDLIGKEIQEIPRVSSVPDVEDAVSIARSGARTKLEWVDSPNRIRIRGHVEPIMAKGTQGEAVDHPLAEEGSQTSFIKGHMIGSVVALRDEAQLVASIDVLELLEERGIADAAGLGVALEENKSSDAQAPSRINWSGALKDVLQEFHGSIGLNDLEISLWAPHEEEGAKLVEFYNSRNQEPSELLMTATMLFAMEESSQVEQKQFALRVMEDNNSLVSIREGDGERLTGTVIFTGPDAARIYEPLALRLAERCAEELLERALLESGL